MFSSTLVKNISFLLSIFFIFINNINNVFCRSIVEKSNCEDTAKLSSLYPESNIAKIELIKNIDNNFISSSDGSYQSQNGYYPSKKFGVKLTVYNTGCNGIEQIIIDVYGKTLNGDVDNVFVMSLENNNGINEYFSIINDWDGRVVINGEVGGVFMSPPKGNKLFQTSKNNLIDTMFDGITSMTEYRERLSNGNINDFTLLNSEPVGTNTSPLRYHITNNGPDAGNYIDFVFEYGNNVGTRSFTQSFDTSSNNDYIIGIGTDQNWVKYDKFDVTVKCYEYTFA